MYGEPSRSCRDRKWRFFVVFVSTEEGSSDSSTCKPRHGLDGRHVWGTTPRRRRLCSRCMVEMIRLSSRRLPERGSDVSPKGPSHCRKMQGYFQPYSSLPGPQFPSVCLSSAQLTILALLGSPMRWHRSKVRPYYVGSVGHFFRVSPGPALPKTFPWARYRE